MEKARRKNDSILSYWSAIEPDMLQKIDHQLGNQTKCRKSKLLVTFSGYIKYLGLDFSSLVVVEGKICWDLYIDGLVISSDGNLLDALAAAIEVALSDTGIPKVNLVALGASHDEEEPEVVDISDEEFLQFDTSRVPVITTLTKVGMHYIVDATSEEESQMSSAVSVSVNRHGQICGLTKRGGAGLDPSVILDMMISVAKHVSQQFISLLDSEIAAAEASE